MQEFRAHPWGYLGLIFMVSVIVVGVTLGFGVLDNSLKPVAADTQPVSMPAPVTAPTQARNQGEWITLPVSPSGRECEVYLIDGDKATGMMVCDQEHPSEWRFNERD